MECKRAQISMEYMVVIGFVTAVVIVLFGLAFFYSNTLEDQIKDRQLEDFAHKIISSAESVYFSGEPSKTTVNAYLPRGVSKIEIEENQIEFYFEISSGQNIRAYQSDVPITGEISSEFGTKVILLSAEADSVLISSN